MNFEEFKKLLYEPTTEVPPGAPGYVEDKPWYQDVYNFGKDLITGGEATADLEARGISTEGAPFMSRYEASGPPLEKDKVINFVRQNENMEFKLDEKQNTMLFRPPTIPGQAPAQWTTINPPGLDAGDIADLAGELPVMASATGGYALLKNIANKLPISKKMKFLYGLTGLFGGGNIGGRIQLAISKGGGELSHLSAEEIAELEDPITGYGAKMGATEVVGAAAMRAIGGTFKKLRAMAKNTDMPTSIRERAIAMPDNMPEVIGQVNDMLKRAGVDKQFAPDSARVLNDPEFMSAIVALEKQGGTEGAELVRKLYGNNQDALKEFLEVITKSNKQDTTLANIGTSRSPELDVGTDIKKAVTGEIDAEKMALSARQSEAGIGEELAQTSLRDASGVAGSEIGVVLRPDVQATHKALRTEMELAFKNLADETDATQPKFMPANTLKVAKELAAKLGKGPAKGTVLSNKEDELVQQIYENVRSSAGKGMAEPLSYGQMNEYIKLLRKGIRRAQRGQLVGTGLDVDVLYKLEKAAVLDKMNRLNGMPEDLAQKHLDLDKAYTAQKSLLEAKGVQNIVDYDAKGFKLKDEQLFGKIFGPDKGPTMGAANDLIALMEKGNGIGNNEAIKRAIVDEFLTKTTASGTKTINADTAQRWLASHKNSLKQWMSDDEIKLLTDARDSGKLLSAVEAKAKTFDADMKKVFGDDFIKISQTNSAEIFERAWKDASTIQQHKQILQDKYPHIWEQLYNVGLENIKRDLLRTDKILPQGIRTVSYNALKDKLNDYKWVDKVRLTYGDEYVSNLTKLMEASEILARAVPIAGVDKTTGGFIDMIGKVFFGPLDHRRFAIKALTKYAVDQQNQNFQSIVLNPTALNQAAKDMTTSEGSKQIQQILGGQAAVAYRSGDQFEDKAAGDAVNQLRNDINISGNPRLRDKIQRALTVGP